MVFDLDKLVVITSNPLFKAVLRIRIRTFFSLLDPDLDPQVRGTDPDQILLSPSKNILKKSGLLLFYTLRDDFYLRKMMKMYFKLLIGGTDTRNKTSWIHNND